jgi:CcmD family protein
MEQWAFVLSAYGIVWTALVLYIVFLNLRLRRIEAELTLHRSRSTPSHEDR